MQGDSFSLLSDNIDATKIQSLNQKRVLAFLNHWIQHTTIYLNKFASNCEDKLETINRRIRKASDNLATLESKLSSIDGLEIEELPADIKSVPKLSSTSPEPSTTEAPPTQIEEPEPAPKNNPISKDARFMSYFKMVAVGVPPAAVKIKMASEGLDPSLLDDPNADAPLMTSQEATQHTPESDSDGSWEN